MQAKRKEIAHLLRPVADAELTAFAGIHTAPGFRQSLVSPGHLTVIAEVKRASPSVGTIRMNVDAVTLAETYAEAGADCGVHGHVCSWGKGAVGRGWVLEF